MLDYHITCWDALSDVFPIGTVSGSPKVKAMELIDQIIVMRCGPYSGGLRIISYSDGMHISIALNTIIFPTGSHFNIMYSYKDASNHDEMSTHTISVNKMKTE